MSSCARRQFFQADARPDAAPPLPAAADSASGLTAGRQYARHGRLYEKLIGRHHRPTWAAPITAPVLHLATAQPGGLRPGKLGGGFNSISLSLSTPDGRLFVLRTLDKDPVRVIPRWLRGTFLTNALRDNISATNPYAALTVPPLAAALGVPCTRPRVVYVRPDDPIFAPDSLRRFRGQLGLLEEKLSGRSTEVPGLGRVSVVGSAEAFQQVFTSPAYRFDQPALLRARLLDAWLGDWDRHAGQWNWTARPAPGADFAAYQPLPKDRDMVFYRLDDGAVGWLFSHVIKRPWNTFALRFTNVRGLLHNGHYLDVRGLNALSRPQFRAAALAMQRQLPDTLLIRALRRLPPAVQALESARTLVALRARRAALPAFADDFYRERARQPMVGGTAQADRFEVLRYADSTVVTVKALAPDGVAPGPVSILFRRTFFPAETKLIQLEALGGNDIFSINNAPGASASRPRLRLYGGPGDDQLQGDAKRRGVRLKPGSAPAKSAFDQISKD